MKSFKFFAIGILLMQLCPEPGICQTGVEAIYQGSIRQFNSFNFIYSTFRHIYIQQGIQFGFGGNYLKLHKPTNTLGPAFNNMLDPRFFNFCSKELEPLPIETFVVSEKNENIVFFNSRVDCDTTYDSTMYTIDGGANVKGFFDRNSAGFAVSPIDSAFYCSGSENLVDFYIYKSTNLGQTWEVADTLNNIVRLRDGGYIVCCPFNREIVYIRGKNNLLVSTNSGKNFTSSEGPSFSKIIFNHGDHSTYGLNKFELHKSINKGLSWNLIYYSPGPIFNDLQPVYETTNQMLAGTDAGVMISTNSGYNWNIYNNAFPGSSNVIGISKDWGNTSTLYAGTEEGLFKIDHPYFEPVTFQSHFKIGNIFQYHFIGEKTNYYYTLHIAGDTILSNGLRYYKVIHLEAPNSITYEYIDSLTQRWFQYTSFCNSLVMDFNLETGDLLNSCGHNYARITSAGLLNNVLGYTGYLRKMTTYPHPFAFDLTSNSYIEKFGYLGAFGYTYMINLTGAIVDGYTYGTIIGVQQTTEEIPSKFSLGQNYPNPFNPKTIINYELSEGMPSARNTVYVVMKVFDVNGKEVSTLVNEKQSAGKHEVEFDGNNFPSGIYFYRIAIHSDKLEAGEFSETKRMILLK